MLKCTNCKSTIPDPKNSCRCMECQNIMIDASLEENTTPNNQKGLEREVGICILLMDASWSMTNEKAFDNSNKTKARIVAESVAYGIFDLHDLSNKEDAYVAGYAFDENISDVFFSTVNEILNDYSSVTEFANHIEKKLINHSKGTDINLALKTGHEVLDKFLNKSIGHFQDYTPLIHTGELGDIPNARVLIYTDGEHTQGDLNTNIFTNNKKLLMGAYLESSNRLSEGQNSLNSIVGTCPKHNQKNFFHYKSESDYAQLRSLFSMSSGTSGFCPICLDEKINSEITL